MTQVGVVLFPCCCCCCWVVLFCQVDEVKNIMSDNIEAVLSRGEKLDLLVDKTDNLMFEVSRHSTQLRPGG